jgi:hypothetical protein
LRGSVDILAPQRSQLSALRRPKTAPRMKPTIAGPEAIHTRQANLSPQWICGGHGRKEAIFLGLFLLSQRPPSQTAKKTHNKGINQTFFALRIVPLGSSSERSCPLKWPNFSKAIRCNRTCSEVVGGGSKTINLSSSWTSSSPNWLPSLRQVFVMHSNSRSATIRRVLCSPKSWRSSSLKLVR